MNYTILILYRVTNHWLELKREQRIDFFATTISPIINQFKETVTVRFFDSEAFHANTSDFMIIDCTNLKDYYYFIEHLRDSALFGKPYLVLNDVIIGIENGFQAFETTKFKT